MTPSVTQIIGTTYATVLAEKRKAANQWAESAFLNALEAHDGINRVDGGSALESPLDWRKNPDTDMLAADTTATSVTKTTVLSGTSFAWAELLVPINWTFGDEARNSELKQKISLSKGLISNGIDSHDDEIELDLFSTSTDGFLGLQNLIPTSGQPNVGGINGASETFWRNATGTYLIDGSDMEAQMTTVWNSCAKGTGSKLAPSLLVSGATAQAIYEGGLVAFQRFNKGDKGNGGFTALAFKTSDYVFSQYGATLTTDPVYFLNGKSFKLTVAKGAFRDLKEAVQMPGFPMYNRKIYSMLQTVIDNPSRLGVITHA